MLKKELITLDIDDNYIRLVTSKTKQHKIEVVDVEDIKIQQDIYRYEKNQYIKSIKSSIQEYLKQNKIKIKNVSCTTQNENIIFRNIQIPYIKKENEIIDVLKLQLNEYMPINLDEYILQYKIQNIIQNDNEKNMNLNVVLFPKNISITYKNLIKDMGLKPIILDTSFNSINKLYVNNFLDVIKNDSFITAEIRDKYISLNIFDKGILKISSTLTKDYNSIDKIMEIYNYSNSQIKNMYIYGQHDNKVKEELEEFFDLKYLEVNNIAHSKEINLNKYINNIGLMINI